MEAAKTPSSLTSALRESRVRRRQDSFQEKEDDKRENLGWGIYGSEISDYARSFQDVLEGRGILDIIKQKQAPVVVDLMGPSGTLASLFKIIKNKDKFGLAVSLADERSEKQLKRDRDLGIIQIAGDITKGATWRRIESALYGRKADLLMERALEGLLYLPLNDKLCAILLNKAWKLLSDNQGTLLAEVPLGEEGLVIAEKQGQKIEGWVSFLKKNGINAIYSSSDIKHGGTFLGVVSGYLKLVKTPDSPKNLPFLPSKV